MSLLRIAFCFGVIIPALVSAQTARSRKDEQLRGPVRSMVVERVRLSDKDKSSELNRRTVDIASYDEDRRLNERDVYDDYGFLVGRERYRYGPSGLLSESTLFDVVNKKISERRTFQYDSKGKTVSIRTYDTNGRLRFRQDFKNDINGNLLIEVMRTPNKLIGKRISKLDPDGAINEMISYSANGDVEEKWRYTYDALGNLAEESLYNPDGSRRKVFVHRYELDAHGNWIKRSTTVSLDIANEPHYESIFVTYRTIKYF